MQAGLRLCCSHIPHCLKSHIASAHRFSRVKTHMHQSHDSIQRERGSGPHTPTLPMGKSQVAGGVLRNAATGRPEPSGYLNLAANFFSFED